MPGDGTSRRWLNDVLTQLPLTFRKIVKAIFEQCQLVFEPVSRSIVRCNLPQDGKVLAAIYDLVVSIGVQERTNYFGLGGLSRKNKNVDGNNGQPQRHYNQ